MKVKVGDRWYTADDGPITVQLTAQDRENIANMAPGADRYARFEDGYGVERAERWMNEGYEPA